MPQIFGVRHLSPAGAWHLLRLLEKVKPALVLVEGPEDLSGLMPDICRKETKPPIAIMAYSETVPIQTILYPFAEYSPEYQAILWAHKNGCPCRFIDLPSSVFLAFSKLEEERRLNRLQEENGESPKEAPKTKKASAERAEEDRALDTGDIYERLAELSEETDQESYWERNFEHTLIPGAYHAGAAEYGRQLRALAWDGRRDRAENEVREAFMKRKIADALAEGIPEDKIVVVTGAYHVAGLETCAPMTDEERDALPRIPCKNTLMPYSYYRLSVRSGYGAGNKAPAYFGLLWKALNEGDPEAASYAYLTRIAAFQRKYGNMSSSAEVIEAVRLANTLAEMKGGGAPTLRDLRDSATTCMGHGQFSEIALACADAEIGTRIGSLPPGISRTSIQEDFYRMLSDLRLEKYKTLEAQTLELDLRENTRVKSEKAAFLDLERSFFLHRLCALGIHFATHVPSRQEKATWAEEWRLQWTPEAEIEIVEAALKGDTVELAAAFSFHERLESAATIADTAVLLQEACLCGMPETVGSATRTLQGLAINAASVAEIAKTGYHLSAVIRFGSIRRLNPAPLEPLLNQLFLRACLLLPGACVCNNTAVGEIIEGMRLLNDTAVNHDFLDSEQWLETLSEISSRDDLNTKASGYAAAILLERSRMDNALLAAEVRRRLSPGIPADLGAGWFEGLAMKNRYALITRLSLWEQLAEYIDTLDDDEFKRALVFLRRAFESFTAHERCQVAENLGEIWQVNPQQVSEVLNNDLTGQEQEMLSGLEDFDFGDL